MDTFEKRLWSVNEFCKTHGFGRTTYYKLVSLGLINHIKIGRRTFISVNEMNEFMSRLEADSKNRGVK